MLRRAAAAWAARGFLRRVLIDHGADGVLVHPSSRLFAGPEDNGRIVVGRGSVIQARTTVASGDGLIEIGAGVYIGPTCVLSGGVGGLKIGDHTQIGPQTIIVGFNHLFEDRDVLIADQGVSSRGITIGRDVWVSAHVTILDGVTVGDGAVIGAGAVVTKDVAPFTVVAGVPAKQIGTRGND